MTEVPNTHIPNAVDLFRSLGSIEGKQDLILLRIDQQDRAHKDLEGQVDGLGKRVATVETKLAYWGGALAIVSAASLFFKDKILVILGIGA